MKPKRGIVLFDIHFPDNNKKATNIAYQFTKDWQPDFFILGGDQLDLGCISIFNKGKPKLLENKRLIKDYKGFQREIIDKFENILPKKCKKVFMIGNHEYRVDRLLESEPQLEGLIEIENNLYLHDWEITPYNDVLSVGHMNFIHGHYTNKYHANKTLQIYGDNIFYGHCFDIETELLTKRGWLKYQDIKENDVCLTLNKNTDLLEWNSINKKYIFEHDGKMIHIQSSSIDLLVDEMHGLIVKANKTGKLQEIKAKDLFYINKNYF